MYEEKSQLNKEVYQGHETSCTVAGELFSRGKIYSFGVCATAQGESGKESDSEFTTVYSRRFSREKICMNFAV